MPNAQDVAMLVISDIRGYRIGDLTGTFGYRTQGLANNHVTMIGYPVNLDLGEVMERNDAGAPASRPNNTVVYGSAMGGGASGGPWVQDFGVAPASTPTANEPTINWPLGLNYIVAVTSYGPAGAQGYLGASILDSRFTNMLALVCGQAPGNC